MLILECSQGCYGRTDGRSITISLRNFVGEGIKISKNIKKKHWLSRVTVGKTVFNAKFIIFMERKKSLEMQILMSACKHIGMLKSIF